MACLRSSRYPAKSSHSMCIKCKAIHSSEIAHRNFYIGIKNAAHPGGIFISSIAYQLLLPRMFCIFCMAPSIAFFMLSVSAPWLGG